MLNLPDSSLGTPIASGRTAEIYPWAYLIEYARLAPARLDHLEAWIAILAACKLLADSQDKVEFLLPIAESYFKMIPP